MNRPEKRLGRPRRPARPLCIYHINCADGFAAAWVVRLFFGAGNVDFHAADYGDPPPDVGGRDVIIVDFSYPRPVLDEMHGEADSLLILDHHESAAAELAGLPAPAGRGDWAWHHRHADQPHALFDMQRSGCGITWDFFFPGRPRPDLVTHIEDRDLWRFHWSDTKAYYAGLMSHPFDFEVWDRVAGSVAGTAALIADGVPILRRHQRDVAEMTALTRRCLRIGGHVVPACNLPRSMGSDGANLLAEGEPFAAAYYDVDGKRVISLRSVGLGLNVAAIAAQYGGGGHPTAASFKVALDRVAEFEP